MGTENQSNQLSVNVTPEALENALAQAIINTALGEKLNDALNKAINTTSSHSAFGHRSLIQQAVDSYLMEVVRAEAVKLIEPRREEIRQKINDHLSQNAIDSVIAKIFETFNRNF